MDTYYNENDPFAVAWLRELMKAGMIADGEIDDRSIAEVSAGDVQGFDQCHFFAGIGGWSYALRLAGWSDDRPVWTGSCPCQPFSSAGKGGGAADPRHLWPEWVRLIRECHPSVIFGEQVEAAIRHGWLDLVFGDLEGEGYACGAAVLGAHSVGAPHIRQRVWFVAESRHKSRRTSDRRIGATTQNHRQENHQAVSDDRTVGDVGHADKSGSQGRDCRELSERARQCAPWAPSNLVWLPCRDGKARPTQPGLQPLAHGVSGRVGMLRGAGNSIVPQIAAAFIESYLDAG